jgi:hypothetical protein
MSRKVKAEDILIPAFLLPGFSQVRRVVLEKVSKEEKPLLSQLVEKCNVREGDEIGKWIVAFSLPLCRFVDLGFSPLAVPPMQEAAESSFCFPKRENPDRLVFGGLFGAVDRCVPHFLAILR